MLGRLTAVLVVLFKVKNRQKWLFGHKRLTTYEVCPKSNETVVIKSLLNYTKVKVLQSNPLPLVNTCAFAFSMIQNILGRHFLGSSCASLSRPF